MTAPGDMTLPVVVKAYEPGAMHDQFDDGGFQIFDAVHLCVTGGPLEGRDVTLFVDARDQSAVETWSRPGTRMRVSIDPRLIESGDTLFSGAATIEAIEP